jgi:predicted DCC family thiol-disulfide oxidoreductase YuxK
VISLSSEITDAKGRRARRGWVFFDRDCSICTSLANRFRHTLEARGFGLAALQDPRAQALLDVPPAELLREMRLVTAEGQIYGGAEAIVYLSSQIWWAKPIYVAAKIPGVMAMLKACYRWFADHRTCLGGTCAIPNREPKEFAIRSRGAKHG